MKINDEQKCHVGVGVSFQTFRVKPFIGGVTCTLESLQGLHSP